MNDTTQWFSGKRENLLLFSYTVKIVLTQHIQIYCKTFLGMKYLEYQSMELSASLSVLSSQNTIVT